MPHALIQKLTEHFSKGLPFAVYRKPNAILLKAVLQKDSKIVRLRNFSETGFVFAPFDLRNRSVLIRADELQTTPFESNPLLEPKRYFFEGDKFQKEFHEQLVNKGVAHIRKGAFQKVVLSRRVAIECQKSPFELFKALLSLYPTAFCYLWHHPKIGTWLGATPETLLRLENNQFTSVSLAGTQKYEGRVDVEWGQKELDEQGLVTKYLIKVLDDNVSFLKVHDRETIKAGNLLHLRTKLSGTIKAGRLSDIVSALHPTPAVCGIPMNNAKRFILDNEKYEREFYTGFLGELNFKKELRQSSTSKSQKNKEGNSIKMSTTLFVNLRCMQIKNGQAFIYVGGGITKDSDAKKEWMETVAKTNTMFQVLANSN